jgi:hypothetical protein
MKNEYSTPYAKHIPTELQDFGFLVQWTEFVADRKERRIPLTIRSATMLLKTLSERPRQAEEALKTAIAKGWRGFEWEWVDPKPKPAPAKKTGRDLSNSMGIG